MHADDFNTAVVATSRAFWPDPLFGFFARNRLHETIILSSFADWMIRDSLKHGDVDVIMHNGRVVASASWLRPGDAPRPRLRETGLALRVVRMLISGRNRVKALGLLYAMGKKHPKEPHWYLGLIGVDPAFQGKGLGTALISYRLQQCDESHMPAYLETQKPENVPYYERFGFRVLEEIRHEGCPSLWIMWRDPHQL